MNTYECEKYLTTKEKLRETIDKYGVAIIPDVLDEIECNEIVNGLWNYFEHISSKWVLPINRNDNTTWREIYKLFPLHSMLFQNINSGHAQICWDVRQNPKIVDIFSYFWNYKNEDLLVSFDGFSFNLPPEVTKKGWKRPANNWYHTDQSYLRNNFECIQSWVTGLDVNEGDATLAFMESSNQYHGEFATHFDIKIKEDWFKLTKEQETFYLDKGCSYKNIKCKKGSLVFWDSRTIHCGTEALKERATPNLRAIIYICYTPRNLCDEKNRKKKLKAFEELRTTNHYPHKVKLFAKNPRTYGGDITNINSIQIIEKPVLTELGFKLVGY
jgi:hypothetical protein